MSFHTDNSFLIVTAAQQGQYKLRVFILAVLKYDLPSGQCLLVYNLIVHTVAQQDKHELRHSLPSYLCYLHLYLDNVGGCQVNTASVLATLPS